MAKDGDDVRCRRKRACCKPQIVQQLACTDVRWIKLYKHLARPQQRPQDDRPVGEADFTIRLLAPVVALTMCLSIHQKATRQMLVAQTWWLWLGRVM